ncbi:MAG TPA: hypothetical protein VHD35_08325 [Chitinophagaceae bacterium]|jgi:hypothetical protein|nr:hypothetical protein [Chitinophagaceae bacterium]
MGVIVTYDVPSKHVELKKTLFALGYTDRIVHQNGYIYLPNTTVYHHNKSASQARDNVQSICNQLNIELERCIATQWGPDWAAIHGKPF